MFVTVRGEYHHAVARARGIILAHSRGGFVTCARCASDMLKNFDAELAIHFQGRESVDIPHVLVYSAPKICLNCGHVEFVVPDELIAQLKNGVSPAQRRESAS